MNLLITEQQSLFIVVGGVLIVVGIFLFFLIRNISKAPAVDATDIPKVITPPPAVINTPIVPVVQKVEQTGQPELTYERSKEHFETNELVRPEVAAGNQTLNEDFPYIELTAAAHKQVEDAKIKPTEQPQPAASEQSSVVQPVVTQSQQSAAPQLPPLPSMQSSTVAPPANMQAPVPPTVPAMPQQPTQDVIETTTVDKINEQPVIPVVQEVTAPTIMQPAPQPISAPITAPPVPTQPIQAPVKPTPVPPTTDFYP